MPPKRMRLLFCRLPNMDGARAAKSGPLQAIRGKPRLARKEEHSWNAINAYKRGSPDRLPVCATTVLPDFAQNTSLKSEILLRSGTLWRPAWFFRKERECYSAVPVRQRSSSHAQKMRRLKTPHGDESRYRRQIRGRSNLFFAGRVVAVPALFFPTLFSHPLLLVVNECQCHLLSSGVRTLGRQCHRLAEIRDHDASSGGILPSRVLRFIRESIGVNLLD